MRTGKCVLILAALLATGGVLTGCDSGMKTIERYVFNDDSHERAEANAAAAEAAEEEVAKAKAEESAVDLASPVKESEAEYAKAEPKKAVKPEPKKEAKKEVKPEAKKVAKTETKAETQPKAKVEAKPVAQAEAKPVAKAATNSATSSATTEPRKPASVAKEMVYVVQFGAFRVKANAEKFFTKLKGEGLPVVMKPLHHSKNGDMFVVRLEPTPNRAEAEQMMAKAQTEKSVQGQLISFPVEK